MPPGPAASPARSTVAFLRLGVVLLGLVISACGADDGLDEPGAPSASTDRVQVADARFDGEFQITSLTAAGQDVPLTSGPIISIETVFGGLSLMPGCNTYFGSFTLLEDGTASFTVAGGSTQECEDQAEQEQAVLDVLQSVTGWQETGSGFRFTAANADQLTVTR